MGLIYNILIGVVHIFFVITDILLVMITAKIIYDRWRSSQLKQAVEAIEPIIGYVLNYAKKFSEKLAGRTFSEKTLLLLIIICLSLLRLLTISLL